MNHELRDECLVQLCCGIKFLHDRGVAHRDLKSDNILLTKQKNVVIADFGLGDYVWRREPLVTGKKGTYMHISPEKGQEPFNCFKCDMYSLGVVYWCMLYRVDVIDLKPKEPLLTIVSRTFHVPDTDSFAIADVDYAMLATSSGLVSSSDTKAPRYLKHVIFLPPLLIPILKTCLLSDINIIFSAFIGILYAAEVLSIRTILS
uniref:Protein kinase domain-containing protein n=1 Tax=Biomphalaria glabrata TaxID=6526 RepID=A0A2C9JW36_BIOGL